MTKANLKKPFFTAVISSLLFAGVIVAVPLIASAQSGSDNGTMLSMLMIVKKLQIAAMVRGKKITHFEMGNTEKNSTSWAKLWNLSALKKQLYETA